MPKASPLLWINNSWAEPDSAEATPAPSFRTYPLLLELYAPQNQVVGRFLTDELRHVRQESLTIIPPPQHTWHRADESDATQGVRKCIFTLMSNTFSVRMIPFIQLTLNWGRRPNCTRVSCFPLTKMLQLLLVILNRALALAPIKFYFLILCIDDALGESKQRMLKNNRCLSNNSHITCWQKLEENNCKCTRSKTSQLLTDPRTGLWCPAGAPSMFSLRRHSSSVLNSSVGQARVRACSCSKDSELWTPREHSWSWASASLQLEMTDAFKQCCWLWHNVNEDDDDGGGDGDGCEDCGWKENNSSVQQKHVAWPLHRCTHLHGCSLLCQGC